ncbi:MAG TPA: hypothetical protein VMV73_04470 [Candidatus Dormibacteraeota bacterium]|nr:hypothetical protein [Candidatus Dormibacteraeota bacterium]
MNATHSERVSLFHRIAHELELQLAEEDGSNAGPAAEGDPTTENSLRSLEAYADYGR